MCAWIKVDQSLFTHRKIATMADHLDIDEMQAVGCITALWSWAIDNAPDGKLTGSDRMIAKASHWYGSPTRYVEALFSAGFMDDDFNGNRELHNWEQWAGALVRKRAIDRERLRHWRDRKLDRKQRR